MKKILILLLTITSLLSCERQEMFEFAKSGGSQLKITPGDASLTINWNAISGAVAYQIWYNDLNDPDTATQSGSDLTVTSTTITSLANGTIYYVWLKVIKVAGGTASIIASGTGIPNVIPASVTTISIIGLSGTSITITWDADVNATAYEVWYSTIDSTTDAIKHGTDVLTPGYTLTGLITGTTYYIWVIAKNSAGKSSFGSYASHTPVDIPLAPVTLTVTPLTLSLYVSWPSVPTATEYQIWINASSADSFAAIQYGSNVAGTSTTISSLPASIHYIWVKAVNAAGVSDFSSMGSGTPNP